MLQPVPGALWHVPARVVPTPQQKLLVPVQVDVPAQTPSVQTSELVQPRVSLHPVPLGLFTIVQMPPVQARCWHWFGAGLAFAQSPTV